MFELVKCDMNPGPFDEATCDDCVELHGGCPLYMQQAKSLWEVVDWIDRQVGTWKTNEANEACEMLSYLLANKLKNQGIERPK